MSTRRARIKAIASLPVRRKNADPNSNNKQSENISHADNHEQVKKVEEEKPKEFSDTSIKDLNENSVQKSRDESQKLIDDNTFCFADAQASSCRVTSSVNDVTNFSDNSSIFQNSHRKTPIQLNLLQHSESISEIVISANTKEDDIRLESTLPSVKDLHSSDNICISKVVENTSSKSQPNSVCRQESNVPDTSADEADGIDGITPLQSAQNIPKPIDVLKNEIISECAEVIFDPIVPLPSPSKVRPKLKPAPRLAPLRRNSVQGSASESEDEGRRMIGSGSSTALPPRIRHNSQTSIGTHHTIHSREASRVRSDSVCSAISQSVIQPNTPSSPVKEKHLLSKLRRNDGSRRVTALRRRQRARDGVTRESLTMYDLIFYNPTTNPIILDKDEENAQKEQITKNETVHNEEPIDTSTVEEVAGPVPQIKLGPDGQIILDEKACLKLIRVCERTTMHAGRLGLFACTWVIEHTDSNKRLSGGVVHEGEWSAGGRGRYTRAARTAEWSDAETVRFYRALAALGTDFTLMAPLFPKRTRRELKTKCFFPHMGSFKYYVSTKGGVGIFTLFTFEDMGYGVQKEERTNIALVEKALRSEIQWDATRLETEFAKERREDDERSRRDVERMKRNWRDEKATIRAAKGMGLKIGKASKALGAAILPPAVTNSSDVTSADDIIDLAMQPRARGRRRKTEEDSQSIKKAKPCYIIPPVSPVTPMSTHGSTPFKVSSVPSDMSKLTIQPNFSKTVVPANVNPIEVLPNNIEAGSLVVLTTTDPNSPSKKVLQTYISDSNGKIKPVNIPTHLLSSVVGLVSKSGPNLSSPRTASPMQVESERLVATPTLINDGQRLRHDSYTITQL
ncbi:Transcription factor TFIIIB component B'' [Eumeta japonica]|uniref:Transcription factor TFIIIB component B n=1 Tax=Eumeta variegata TaxID=151549 RepID=A0A4C1XPK1_EUMVA|nr:Transcription factor TFIIIB component B'' [Eumeta japonica]